MSVEDELLEWNSRAEEMENNPSICIPHEKVYEILMARCRDASNASVSEIIKTDNNADTRGVSLRVVS